MNYVQAATAVSLALWLPYSALAQAGYPQDALCVTGSDTLCSTMPADLVGLTAPMGYTPTTNIDDETGNPFNPQQPNFDHFGWQMFMALNWPADKVADAPGQITNPKFAEAPRVWESWPTVEDVFGGGASECPSNGRLTLQRTAKFHSSAFIEPFTSSPLIDVEGNFVMYDIRLNPREVAYLTDNGLVTKAGQEAFKAANPDGWDLPRGEVKGGDLLNKSIPGAMELKTAWRILPEGGSDSYYTLPGLVEIPAKHSATGKTLCLDVTLGMVGMHIMQKISTPGNFSDFWIWATFEHSRNAPLADGGPISQKDTASNQQNEPPYGPVESCPVPDGAGDDWAFFNPACTTADGAACAPNEELKYSGDLLWEAEPPYAKRYLTSGKFGTQVTRCWQVYESANRVSARFHKALEGTVWANYDLIGVQWANGGLDHPDPLRPFPAPIYLVNTTLETYLQTDPVLGKDGAPSKGAPGSCIMCHDNATDLSGNKSDFSFLGFYASE